MTLFEKQDETAWSSIPVNYRHTLALVQHPRGEPAGLSEQDANERKDRGRETANPKKPKKDCRLRNGTEITVCVFEQFLSV